MAGDANLVLDVSEATRLIADGEIAHYHFPPRYQEFPLRRNGGKGQGLPTGKAGRGEERKIPGAGVRCLYGEECEEWGSESWRGDGEVT